MSERYRKCIHCNNDCPLARIDGLMLRFRLTEDLEILETIEDEENNPRRLFALPIEAYENPKRFVYPEQVY